MRKVLILFNEGTFTWISSVQGEKDILNGMTYMVTAKPWLINGIKTLYGGFLVSSIQYAIFISLLQCICYSLYMQSQNSRYFKMIMMQIRLHHSSIAIILMGKRELVALLNLSSWCLVMVERLFLAVPRGCLRFVIVVFPDHTHLLS